jgi:16S rRNA G966 N2-methylase RsmD
LSGHREAVQKPVGGSRLNALTSLAQLPEFAAEYLGKVKLVYLDPPFNTLTWDSTPGLALLPGEVVATAA